MNNEQEFTNEVIELSNVLFFHQSAGLTSFLMPEQSGNEKKIQINVGENIINIDILIEDAKKEIEKKTIRSRLCEALGSISSDLTEIAKIVTAVLLPLGLATDTVIKISPLLFAGIALVIFNAGTKALCGKV